MKTLKNPRAVCAVVCGFLLGAAAASADTAVPATPQRPVTDSYHGVTVADPYRWLENTDDPQVHAWSAAQDARAKPTGGSTLRTPAR